MTHNTSYISIILWSGKKFSDCKLTKNYDRSDAERTKVSSERKYFSQPMQMVSMASIPSDYQPPPSDLYRFIRARYSSLTALLRPIWASK